MTGGALQSTNGGLRAAEKEFSAGKDMVIKMKRRKKSKIFIWLLLTGILCMPGECYAKTETERMPVRGEEVSNGDYEVEVESSSSMFRVVKAILHVADGSMTADLTLSGTGYLKLFMGTGEEALNAGEEAYIPYAEDEEGAYTYTIPVEALDQEFACAAYSKRKERWYDRQLVVLASSLPEGALTGDAADSSKRTEEPYGDREDAGTKTEPEKTADPEAFPVSLQVYDGNYTMEVTLEGGSGRAAVLSPVHLEVTGGTATASLKWSSPNYDYMVVNGTRYFPVNTEGDSVFEIPVPALDKEVEVIADTVAMSEPHEIVYTLIFHSDTLQNEESGPAAAGTALFLIAVAVGGISLVIFRRRRKEADV